MLMFNAPMKEIASCFCIFLQLKLASLGKEITAAIARIDTSELDPQTRAELSLLHGRTCDAGEAYSEEAERLLTAAVKLLPDSSDAWKYLAHAVWKKQDLASARSCYEEALRRRRQDPEALRSLSMLLRQMPRGQSTARLAEGGAEGGHAAGEASLITESIAVAREAVAYDLSDSASWSCLGNAHLSRFFGGSARHPSDLLNASKAYSKAVALEAARLAPFNVGVAEQQSIGSTEASAMSTSELASQPLQAAIRRASLAPTPDPDLHFNRGTVLQFQEEIPEAVASFTTAHSVDPSLGGKARADEIVRYTARTAQLVASKGGLKPKRIREATEALCAIQTEIAPYGAVATAGVAPASPQPPSPPTNASSPAKAKPGTPSKTSAPSPAQSKLSPLPGGHPSGALRGRRLVSLSQLSAGPNAGTAVILKPVAVVGKLNRPPP